jgi:hypothetical protein
VSRDPDTVYVGQTDRPYVRVERTGVGVRIVPLEPSARHLLLFSPSGARRLAAILRRLAG